MSEISSNTLKGGSLTPVSYEDIALPDNPIFFPNEAWEIFSFSLKPRILVPIIELLLFSINNRIYLIEVYIAIIYIVINVVVQNKRFNIRRETS